MTNGLFITFEGGEGAGKTTILNQVYEELTGRGFEVIKTREPGGIRISEKIRDIIHDPLHLEMEERTEALLYAAARRQHLVEKIVPALNEGKIVLCDRFIDSSLAYQGYARGLGIDEVQSINQFAIQDVMPDKTFYFDIDPELGLTRIKKHSGREINRLDLEKLDFHYKVREGYKYLINRFPERIIEIDASQALDVVYDQVMEKVKMFIKG